MRPLRFLFCVTGVGAGNTTRNLAILRELERMGDCTIRIAAQGKAHELLSKYYDTIALTHVTYSQTGEFSLFEIIKGNLSFPVRFQENVRRLTAIMGEYQPDLVLADSDFYCLRPARKLGLRLVSLNSSAATVEFIRSEGGLPRNCRFSYNLIEKTDYWLQRRYPQRVICPTLVRVSGLAKKFVQVPPMVRPEITALKAPGEEIVVLTGGSGIDVQNIDLTCLRNERIRMVGTALTKVPGGAIKAGFTLDVMQHLRHAKVLVVQGGFSSVSEAVALRIPTVVVPISNHAEQWANGRMIEQLGLGVSAPSPAEAGNAVQRVLDSYEDYLAAARRVKLRTDGQLATARRLWKWAGGR